MDVFELFHRFMPHGHCFLWRPDILLTFLIGDGATVLAYLAIGLGLIANAVQLKGQGAPPFILNNVLLFGMFVFACGIGHAIKIATIYTGLYRLESYWATVTGLISITEAIVLFRTRAAIRLAFGQFVEGLRK